MDVCQERSRPRVKIPEHFNIFVIDYGPRPNVSASRASVVADVSSSSSENEPDSKNKTAAATRRGENNKNSFFEIRFQFRLCGYIVTERGVFRIMRWIWNFILLVSGIFMTLRSLGLWLYMVCGTPVDSSKMRCGDPDKIPEDVCVAIQCFRREYREEYADAQQAWDGVLNGQEYMAADGDAYWRATWHERSEWEIFVRDFNVGVLKLPLDIFERFLRVWISFVDLAANVVAISAAKFVTNMH